MSSTREFDHMQAKADGRLWGDAPPPDVLVASEVLDAIEKRHPGIVLPGGWRDWVFIRELRMGTGYGPHVEQRVDAWAMCTRPSQHLRRVAYEVKVSRSDFLRELKEPRKRRPAMRVSNEFYFAVPRGLVSPDEVPEDCGLVEVGPDVTGKLSARVRVAAPVRDSMPPNWLFVAALLRRDSEPEVAL